VKSLGTWALVFVCALIFAFIVDLGGNQFGVPDSVLPFLFAANLTLFLGLLARFVGRPILSFLDARAEGITRELEEAREKVSEAEQLREQVQRRLDDLSAEVAAMKARAERDGEAEAQQIAEQAVTEQERFLKRVEDEIERRTAEARANLSKETAELTAKLTKDLLKQELTEDDRRRILDRSLSAMGRESGRD
jgi:F-type H+-transporting ATPase subunit b